MSEEVNRNFIDPILTEPHFSTRIYRGYVAYLLQTFGHSTASAIVAKTGLTLDYVNNEHNWVSEVFADRFYQVLNQEPGVAPDYSYLAGRLSNSQEVQGPVQFLAVQLLSPKQLFKQIEAFSRNFNKTDEVTVKTVTSKSATVVVRSRRKTENFSLIVDNWIGFLEGVPELYGLPKGECKAIRLDSQTASYHVTWHSSSAYFHLNRIRILSAILTAAVSVGILVQTLYSVHSYQSVEEALLNGFRVKLGLLLGTTFAYFASKFRLQSLRNRLSDELAAHLKTLMNEVHQSKLTLDRKYNELHLISEVVKTMSKYIDVNTLIQSTVKEIRKTLKYDRVFFMRHDPELNVLKTVALEGFVSEQEEAVKKYRVSLDVVTDEKFHIGNIFKNDSEMLIPVTQNLLGGLSAEGQALLRGLKSSSFLMCTVSTELNRHGVLLVDYVDESKRLQSEDLQIIRDIGKQLAIFLDNSLVLEQEKKLRSAFQQYVPAEVIAHLMKNDEQSISNGESQQVTILFSDLRDSTKMSDTCDPRLLVQALNYYFDVMNEIVYRNGGHVDKFVGDSVHAVYNAFGKCSDHQAKAVKTGIEMIESLPAINKYIRTQIFKEVEAPEFKVGIGIHVGDVILGNLGSSKKREFTVLGQTVNLASRIEAESKSYPNSVLVSQEVFDSVKDTVPAILLGERTLKGISKSVILYRVLQQQEQATNAYESENTRTGQISGI